MRVTCPACGVAFRPQGDHQALLEGARETGMRLVMLTCAECRRSVPVDPATLSAPVPGDAELRCPRAGCNGYVSFVDDGGFRGCGECGAVWTDEAALVEDVKAIVDHFPHRRAVYRVAGDGFRPSSFEEEPPGYEDAVRGEIER